MPWKVDSHQSKIEFLVKHLMIAQVRGRFASFEGTLDINEAKPEASRVQGTVDIASIHSGISLRDTNLRSAGFFDVRRFPTITFRSTRVGPFEGDSFKVHGDLTIKGVTREVVFDVVNRGEMPAEQGKRRWAFSASITLHRKDFGLRWNPLIELGGLLVGDEVGGLAEIQVAEE